MRALLHLPVEIAKAFFFAASIGIGAGVAATSYTHRLRDGAIGAIAGFLIAAAGFGYAIWRNYRPAAKRSLHRVRRAELAAPR
jgi:hypothetical protein